MIKQELSKKREAINLYKQGHTLPPNSCEYLSENITLSWQRSSSAKIPEDRLAAPLLSTSKHHISSEKKSALDIALQKCRHDLKHIAEQSSMVIAVGDIGSTIIWTAASAQMQSAAERVHFIAGGQWCEDMVGTNALALSLKTRQSSCVFSNEHYMPSVQDWVCYAAPIIDPHSKQLIGVIDLSTTWMNHNTLGLLAAERCATIIQTALQEQHQSQLYIHTFSTPHVMFNGKPLLVTPRQIEILTILALCPQGLNLDALHQALYGERKISLSTLKAEMSQLRDLLGSYLVSRPYQLTIHIEADFLQVEQALDAGYISSALQLYTGVFLSKTDSPFLCSWRDYLESRLSQAIFKTSETDVLLKHVAYFPEAIDAIERLLELLPKDHPARESLLQINK